jgi:phosphate starvation-inducible PhoH-like protein
MLGFEKVEKLIERSVIEVAPLAYMRGRTLNDAFIILDEGQNTTVEQMKMFLTRIGFNSQAVITGDITQVDLPRGVRSGLRHSIEVLKDVNDISFNFFSANDEEYEGKQEKERLEKKAQQEALISEALINNAVAKNAITKNAVVEDAVAKNAVAEDASTKDAVAKDAVAEDAVAKKDENPAK